jgi:L-threonylcarbamoyladenylate synthase
MKIAISQAISLLQSGEVVALPTETVYGLAAFLLQPSAIEKIYSLKRRPSSNPLIVHVGSAEKSLSFAKSTPPGFFSLAEYFWPGPLTIILPVCESTVPSVARSGLSTCAFRVPKHPIAQEILSSLSAFVAPSANISGRPSATRAEHVVHDFGPLLPIIDGGECSFGLESTILAFGSDRWEVARLGAISPEALSFVLGYVPSLAPVIAKKPLCPGQAFTHYSPNARLTLSFLSYASCPNKKEVVVGFTEKSYVGAKKCFLLGSLQNPEEAAFRLFDVLRSLDTEGITEAWVDMQVPRSGLWLSIVERLSKAAGFDVSQYSSQ